MLCKIEALLVSNTILTVPYYISDQLGPLGPFEVPSLGLDAKGLKFIKPQNCDLQNTDRYKGSYG